MTNNTPNEAKKKWNDMLDAINEKLDQASDAGDDAGNWMAMQREKLKASYHDAVADNAEDADEKIEHRLKATQAKAKAAGHQLD